MSPTELGSRSRTAARSLVTEVLAAQLAVTALVGIIALAGLAWTSGSVIRNNLAHWAAQWEGELNELGAPFYLSDRHEAVLGIERFLAKYPEIDRVTWYRPSGTPLMSLGHAGVPAAAAPALDAATLEALAAKAGKPEPYLLTEDPSSKRRFRLAGPIWTESLQSGSLLDFDPAAAKTSSDLLGFVAVDLDFSSYESAFLPRLALASAALLMLLASAWLGGRMLLKRSLAPLSALQHPLQQLAEGDLEVEFPSAGHRELKAIVTALEETTRTLKKREQHLLHLANHDPLTGLPNRHRLLAELDAEIERCRSKGRRSALLFIDLDQFKYVNDTCGHAAGDQLLKAAALQIGYAVRNDDFVARFGGDEFIVLLRNVSRWEAKTIATQVLELMRNLTHVEQGHIFHLQCSIGIAAIVSGRFNSNELIAQADIACRTAKESGRNRVELYRVAGRESEQMERDFRWMRSIREGLESDALAFHYQPLLDIASGEITHYEALLRLQTEQGIVRPQAFLPAAVRFGLMADIDLWVLERAVRALAEFGAEDPRFTLSVNLSSFAFENDALASTLRSLLEEHGVEGGRLVLEITEQLAVRFAASTDKQVSMLRDLGCRLAVDDFGTGYSSFSYIKRLPVDYLKIDGSFVKRLARDRVDQSVVRMLGEVARAAGMRTVAEYVQNAAALALLAQYGIDYAQGYYIGHPAERPQHLGAWARDSATRR